MRNSCNPTQAGKSALVEKTRARGYDDGQFVQSPGDRIPGGGGGGKKMLVEPGVQEWSGKELQRVES